MTESGAQTPNSNGTNMDLSANGTSINNALTSLGHRKGLSASSDVVSKVSNPFETTKVKAYNHKPNIVPPYVLDTLSQAHYKEQLNNSNVNNNQQDVHVTSANGNIHGTTNTPTNGDTTAGANAPKTTEKEPHNPEDDYLTFANDPFIKSMGNDWHTFITSIKQPNTYTKNLISFDQDAEFENKLDGSWGGEERLKFALLGSPSSDEDTYVTDNRRGLWGKVLNLQFLRGQKNMNGKLADNAPKVRSKAGYWMSDEKRADLVPSLKRIFVINPLVPLLLRICIIFFSGCALGLASTIFEFSNNEYEGVKIMQQPSTIMAIVVQCCAIVYVCYISYDEYSGKPLGLRDPLGKMKLIMLDLLFIIFSSANLSLTFNTLYDDGWVCQSDTRSRGQDDYVPAVDSICQRQRALAAFLFMVLCLWVLTFTISIIRVVDRVSVAQKD